MNDGRLDAVRQCLQQALQLRPEQTREISTTTTAADLPGWTSLAHVQLVIALERAFDVTFEAEEIASLASVPAILAALERRQAASQS